MIENSKRLESFGKEIILYVGGQGSNLLTYS